MISLTGSICTFVVCTPTCIPSSYNNEMHNVEVTMMVSLEFAPVCIPTCYYKRVLDKNLCSSFALRPAHTPLYRHYRIDCIMRYICTMNVSEQGISDLPGLSKYIHHLHSAIAGIILWGQLTKISSKCVCTDLCTSYCMHEVCTSKHDLPGWKHLCICHSHADGKLWLL